MHQCALCNPKYGNSILRTFFSILQNPYYSQEADVVVIVQQLDLQLLMQSVPITTNVMSSNTLIRWSVLDTTLCDEVCQ